MSNVLFSSDWHLGHEGMLTFGGRPYSTVAEMDDAIIDNVNDMVDDDDVLYLVGDSCMGQIKDTLPKLARIRCRVEHLPGNHDRFSDAYHGTPAKRETWREAYDATLAEHGGRTLPEQITMHFANRSVQVCHYPYNGPLADHTGKPRYPEHAPIDEGGWLICGHVHAMWRQLGRQINVGIDAWGGKPVRAETLMAMVSLGAAHLDALPWTA